MDTTGQQALCTPPPSPPLVEVPPAGQGWALSLHLIPSSLSASLLPASTTFCGRISRPCISQLMLSR